MNKNRMKKIALRWLIAIAALALAVITIYAETQIW
jgi:hypothetical protein